jgi:hypothetical protein
MSSILKSYTLPVDSLAGGGPPKSPKPKTTALILSSLFSIAANIAITHFRLRLMNVLGFDEFFSADTALSRQHPMGPALHVAPWMAMGNGCKSVDIWELVERKSC